MKQAVQGLKLDGQNWTFSYRIAGKARRMKLGTAPGLVPADARKAAQHFAGLVAIGRCPSSERKSARIAARAAAAPVRDLIEPVLKRYLRHAKERTRESTFTETSRVFRVEVLPKWKGRRLSEISRADVRGLVDGIAKRPAPVSANRALASIKALCNWAVSEEILTVSPAAAIKAPAVEKARERTLTDDELGAVLEACAGLGAYGQGVILLALTGQRRSEVFGMTWAEVDMTAKVWTLPAVRAKNGRQHSIPLSDAALAILSKGAGTCLLGPVFAPVGFSQSKARLGAALQVVALPLAPWTLHDLRRTAASGMAALGVRIETVEKVLNHSSGSFRGIVGVYQKYDFADEKRAALDLWAAHVVALPACPVVLSKAA